MVDWYEVILSDARTRKVTIIFVRFEDLVMEPEYCKLMKFFTGLKALDGTNGEWRI